MRRALVQIERPVFGGGKPAIGVADFRLKGIDEIDAEIMYVRKSDGRRSYPNRFRMSVNKLKEYPTRTVGSGVQLYVAPVSDWTEVFDE